MNYYYGICDLQLTFEFTQVNNRYMDVVVDINNDRIHLDPSSSNGICTIRKMVVLPRTIKIEVSGKTNSDTIIGLNGEIVEDMCVVVKNLKLDHFTLPDHFLMQTIRINGNTTNYLGFNGTAVLRLKYADVVDQVIEAIQ